MTRLDPSAKRALAFQAADKPPPIESGSPQQARQDYLDSFARLQQPLENVTEVFETSAGSVRLKVWRGHGAPDKRAAALLYLHGGGWVVGAPETHEDICRTLANLAGAVVISPDYRLAPEHPFPAGLEDCTAALTFMVAQSEILGIDPARIVVGGDSAGGNLAAVLALMARDNQQPAVLAQLLIYPVTDQRQSFASYSSYGEDFGLTATAMAWYRNHYVPDRADWSDWHVAPLRAASLEGVAPAFVVLAGHDVLFDEGMAYVTRLTSEARATHQIWPGQIHGFVSMGLLIPEAREALNAVAKAWRDLDPSNNR